jgi:transposase
MLKNYNMGQATLDKPSAYEPDQTNPAYQTNVLVEMMAFKHNYVTGYPYNPRLFLKLILFAHTRGYHFGRKIEQFADENKVAIWLTQGAVPSYKTINRFRTNTKTDEIIIEMFKVLRENRLSHGLITREMFHNIKQILE